MTDVSSTLVLDVVAAIVWLLFAGCLVAALLLGLQAQRRGSLGLAAGSAGSVVLAGLLLIVPIAPAASWGAAVLTLLGLAVATVSGAPFVQTVFRLATKSSREGDHGGILVRAKAAADAESREVLRGGIAIGYLERFAIAALVVFGYPEGIAIVVAVKGVGRFTELDDSEARERFIIGTFASMIWGVTLGLLVRLAVT
ncbi:MAG: hypothetical protein ABW204_07055 [Microbacteriaceae bacterium]